MDQQYAHGAGNAPQRQQGRSMGGAAGGAS